MLIAQLSDLHLGHAADSQDERLGRVLAALDGLVQGPDLVLVTGDLVDTPEADAYARVAERLAAVPAPVRVIPGNHDDRAMLRAGLPADWYQGAGADGFLHYALTGETLRIICLDTLIPGAHAGELCAERLAWLRARLDEDAATPTVLAMHHPPFAVGVAGLDRIGAAHGRELGALLATRPHVRRVLAGHVHMPVTVDYAGRVGMTAPSVASGFDPGWLAGESGAEAAPPAFLLHAWQAGQGFVSHVIRA